MAALWSAVSREYGVMFRQRGSQSVGVGSEIHQLVPTKLKQVIDLAQASVKLQFCCLYGVLVKRSDRRAEAQWCLRQSALQLFVAWRAGQHR